MPWSFVLPSLDRVMQESSPVSAEARPQASRSVTRMVTALAALAALLMAAALPLAYFSASRYRMVGGLEASARIHAAEVVELARRNPGFWDFDRLRVSAPRGGAPEERRRVFAADGRLVMEAVPERELAWPVLREEAPVVIDAQEMGHVEAALSMRDVLASTLVVSLASCTLGALIFLLLRVVPLRLLNNALERASFLAAHDLLTGLPNRRLFGDRLRQALSLARRDRRSMAVLCLDLDRFKEVNDTLGHAAGDQVLKIVTDRLSAVLRESDTLARLGGDEFAVIQPRAEQPRSAVALARRLIAALEAPISLDGYQARIGISIGIAMTDRFGMAEPTQLLRDADVALYQAKEAGRGGYRFFVPEMNRKLQERRALEADLRAALETGGFRLAFQPQVRLGDGAVTGAEALLRWARPGSGDMPPDRFIPVAEDTGLIGPIGAWVLREACRCAARWPAGMTVAVNVSPVQFRQPDLHDLVMAALEGSGLPPERLELEITEGVLLGDTEETLATLHRLRAAGVRIAMDDFGTGYSSLVYLQKFPFDKVKIDRSFVRNLEGDPSALAILRAVLGMSRALGLGTLAEGVETPAQAEMLREEGCEGAQGYLFGHPLAPAQLEERLFGPLQAGDEPMRALG